MIKTPPQRPNWKTDSIGERQLISREKAVVISA